MGEVVDLRFIDRMDEILDRQDQLTDSIHENLRAKLSKAQDALEIVMEETARMVARRGDITAELQEIEDLGAALQLTARTFRMSVRRVADKPVQFWEE